MCKKKKTDKTTKDNSNVHENCMPPNQIKSKRLKDQGITQPPASRVLNRTKNPRIEKEPKKIQGITPDTHNTEALALNG